MTDITFACAYFEVENRFSAKAIIQESIKLHRYKRIQSGFFFPDQWKQGGTTLGTCEKILIVDDDQDVCKWLAAVISRMGCDADLAPTMAEGQTKVEQEPYDVVLLDVNLPDGCGLNLVSRIRQTPTEPEVIIITGSGDEDGAEMAIKNGAWDYIQKAGSPESITLSLNRVLQYRKEKIRCRPAPVSLKLKGIVGESKALKICYDQVARAAAGEANVLISGETGTGKEAFARAIHENSPRAGKSLVIVDCAALPETLVESLLFGHERGVYTGADKSREGLVAQADGGTLFLDEVGELSPANQKVFLRVLQERKYRPVGGGKEITSNFRLIAATNRDLVQMVETGGFRKDLLYRLRTVNITLPPLRERDDDVKLLTLHYLSKICERYGIENKAISPDFMEALKKYSWPGNIREMINAFETALTNAGPESTLYSRHLPHDIRLNVIQDALKRSAKPLLVDKPVTPNPPAGTAFATPLTSFKVFRKAAIEKLEKEYLEILLAQTQKSLEKSLTISGLSRSRFYELLKQHSLSL